MFIVSTLPAAIVTSSGNRVLFLLTPAVNCFVFYKHKVQRCNTPHENKVPDEIKSLGTFSKKISISL